MATLTLRNSRFRGRFFTPEGRERRVTFKSPKRKVVEAVWGQILGAVQLGTYTDADFVQYWVRPPKDQIERARAERQARAAALKKQREGETTFGEFAEGWLKQRKRDLAPSGFRDYRSCLDKHLLPFLGAKRLRELGAQEIVDLKEWMYRPEKKTRYRRDAHGNILRGKRRKKLRETVLVTPTPARINNVLVPLRTILRDAHERGLMDAVPKIRRDPEPQRQKLQPLSEEEVGLFLQTVPTEHRAFFAFAFGTGVRVPGEATAVKIEDVDFRTMKVRIGRSFSAGQLRQTTKTNRERWVDLFPELASILKEHVRRAGKVFTAASDDFLFTNSAGEPLDGANLRERVWRRTLQRCGIAYRPMYNTRHSYASILLMKGMSVLYVSEQLGHQSAETTLRYYARFIPKMGAQVHVHLGTTQEKEESEQKSWHMTGTSGGGDGRR